MSEKQTKLSTGRGGARPGAGRPKGSVDKGNALIREMVVNALDGLGGVQYLMECGSDPKTKGAFLILIGKVMPVQVVGDAENPLQHNFTITFKAPNGN